MVASQAVKCTPFFVCRPDGFPADSKHQHSNPLSATASSELPADSEFLTLGLTSSTIGSSPLSPPPPPSAHDFGQNSAVTSSSPPSVARRRGSDDRKTEKVTALPEKYLTSSSANTASEPNHSTANDFPGYSVTKQPGTSAHEYSSA